MKELIPYVCFKGNCEVAFTYYAQHLGGQLGAIFRYAGSGLEGQVPGDWHDKVMHGNVTVCGRLLQGCDVAPDRYEAPRGISFSLEIKDTTEARRIFDALGVGGKVTLPLQQTFWAALFGMVTDQFGIPWLINCERVA